MVKEEKVRSSIPWGSYPKSCEKYGRGRYRIEGVFSSTKN